MDKQAIASSLISELYGKLERANETVESLQSELQQTRGLLSAIYSEAELCHNHGIKLQLVQWLMQKTAAYRSYINDTTQS